MNFFLEVLTTDVPCLKTSVSRTQIHNKNVLIKNSIGKWRDWCSGTVKIPSLW